MQTTVEEWRTWRKVEWNYSLATLHEAWRVPANGGAGAATRAVPGAVASAFGLCCPWISVPWQSGTEESPVALGTLGSLRQHTAVLGPNVPQLWELRSLLLLLYSLLCIYLYLSVSLVTTVQVPSSYWWTAVSSYGSSNNQARKPIHQSCGILWLLRLSAHGGKVLVSGPWKSRGRAALPAACRARLLGPGLRCCGRACWRGMLPRKPWSRWTTRDLRSEEVNGQKMDRNGYRIVMDLKWFELWMYSGIQWLHVVTCICSVMVYIMDGWLLWQSVNGQ